MEVVGRYAEANLFLPHASVTAFTTDSNLKPLQRSGLEVPNRKYN